MSFYDDASLVFLPSGEAGKDGKAYSMKPTNGNGDFTFSRGSNLTATRVDSNGLIEKGRENLILQSNQFDTTWSNAGTTETSGQTGYDGSSDAWLLSKTSSSGFILQNISATGVNTFSVYVKGGDSNWVGIVNFGGSNPRCYFDLVNGVAASPNGGAIDGKIEQVGSSDWYRCSVSSSNSISSVRIYPAEGNEVVGASSGSIYIQDAQLEIGLTATEPIESGATTGLAGLLEDSPRFDYSGGASCPSLLLEPSRTNEIGYSEYFGDSSWTKSAATITNNALTSPQGNNNASYLTDDTANNFHGLYTIKNISSIVTCSIFVKYDNKQFVSFLTNNNGASDRYAYFDLINKTTHTISSGLTASIEDVSGGWLRLSVTSTSSANGYYWWNIAASNSSTAYVGDGTGRVGIFGAQLEQGSYPTSYIPNHSGGSVTREADVCEGAGTSSTFNATEGVFYAEISTNTDDTDKAISLNNGVTGSLNNRLWMGYSTSNKRIYALGYVNNSLQFALNKLMTDESLFVKIACRYKRDDIAFFVNGEKVGTDTSALNFTELSSLDFNIGTGTGASPLYGNVKQVLVFNSYLSDANCITLTS